MRFGFFLPVVLMMAGCAMAPAIPPELETRPASLTSDDIETVKLGLRSALKDPDSARFGGMGSASYVRDEASMLVCGWVNGRNSFGGYTGSQPFMGNLGPKVGGGRIFVTQIIGSRDVERVSVLQLCERQGINIQMLPQA
jgi:hypothetical protein